VGFLEVETSKRKFVSADLLFDFTLTEEAERLKKKHRLLKNLDTDIPFLVLGTSKLIRHTNL